MPHCIFNRTTKCYLRGAMHDVPPHNVVEEIAIWLAVYPDPIGQRWDGATGVRNATAQELADQDNVARDDSAAASLNTAVNKAIRDILLDIEQRLRAAGQTSGISSIAAATTQAEYTAALREIVKGHL